MKTYFRILQFARPFRTFVPQYFVFTVLGIVFGLFNFALVMPLLNVLFDTVSPAEASAMVQKPEFALDISYITGLFNYYFGQVILTEGKSGALRSQRQQTSWRVARAIPIANTRGISRWPSGPPAKQSI